MPRIERLWPTNPGGGKEGDEPKNIRLRKEALRGLVWSIVFGGNLIVPWSIGTDVTHGKGNLGICFGIGLMWVVGWEIGRRWPTLGWNLTAGGVVVALTQFYPMIQIFAGLTAFAIVGGIGGYSGPKATANAPGDLNLTAMTLTVITGAILYVVAMSLGALLSLGRQPKEPAPAKKEKPAGSASPTFDRELDT